MTIFEFLIETIELNQSIYVSERMSNNCHFFPGQLVESLDVLLEVFIEDIQLERISEVIRNGLIGETRHVAHLL